MMEVVLRYLGNLHETLPIASAGTLAVLVSVLCGTLIGLERESKNKPAGLRTMALICVGSAIFTLGSILIAERFLGDGGRIAAQVVTGIGFLGAGAIIRDRGTIIGLTTGATIWTVAAIGVVIGLGYAAAGLGLTVVVLLMLQSVRQLERRLHGNVKNCVHRVTYEPDGGKTRIRVANLLADLDLPEPSWPTREPTGVQTVELRYQANDRTRRMLLGRLAELSHVVSIESPHPSPES